MSQTLPVVFALVAYVALPSFISAGWVRWFLNRKPQPRPSWLSLTGFLLGTVSALIALGGMLYARLVGGFPSFDPPLMTIFRCGMFLSFAGLVFALIGLRWASSTRWFALVACVGTLLFWVASAAAE
jgi:hypothetical protein